MNPLAHPLRRDRRLRIVVAAVVAVALALAAVVTSGWRPAGGAEASDDAVLGVFGVPGWTATKHVIRVGSLQRGYLVAEPVRRVPGERLPVVVLLHGRNGTPAGIAEPAGCSAASGRW